jgi:tetratricopeptide (TPR) repeat protein
VEAIGLNPNYDEARELLADLFIFRGTPSHSITLYTEYLRRSPKNIRALSKLVFCYAQNDQLDKAMATARQIIDIYPNSPVGYVDLAFAHLNAGTPGPAREAADKALDISPVDAEAFRVKALVCSDYGENEAARKMFENALSLDPGNVETRRDYYHHLRGAGEEQKMLSMVHSVIRMEKPFCTEEYCFLADYYREKGRAAHAFHFLHKACKGSPQERELIPPMVDIMLEQGHVAMAMPFLYRYVQHGGWNDVMNHFARHKRLNTARTRDAMELLRYFGQRRGDFRTYIFYTYFEKYTLYTVLTMYPLLLFAAWSFFGMPGIIGLFAMYASFFAGWCGTKKILRYRMGLIAEKMPVMWKR